MLTMTKRPRLEQYRLNVVCLLATYENGMTDCGESEYPKMSFNEVVKYVNDQVYTFIDDGCGLTSYNNIAEKWAKELKFIPKVDKLRIIREVAEECGVLKD